MLSRLPFKIFFASLLLLTSINPLLVAADEEGDDENVVNFAYSVVFGTGVYKVGDQTATVLRMPFSYHLREPAAGRPGLRLLFPVMLGYYDLDVDKIFEGILPSDAASASFVPGVELEFLPRERWSVKPYGNFGYGREFRENQESLIYVAGVKSHYRLATKGNFGFALGGSLVYAGYDPEGDSRESLGGLGIGVDTTYAWGLTLGKWETKLATHLIYYEYENNPGFEQGDRRDRSVTREVELGLALGFVKPLSIWGFGLDRVGLGLRYGNNVKGIRFVTDFPF